MTPLDVLGRLALLAAYALGVAVLTRALMLPPMPLKPGVSFAGGLAWPFVVALCLVGAFFDAVIAAARDVRRRP